MPKVSVGSVEQEDDVKVSCTSASFKRAGVPTYSACRLCNMASPADVDVRVRKGCEVSSEDHPTLMARAAETAELLAGQELAALETGQTVPPSVAIYGARVKLFNDLRDAEYRAEQCRMEMVCTLANIAAACPKDPSSSSAPDKLPSGGSPSPCCLEDEGD